jgi:hypothetical protein
LVRLQAAVQQTETAHQPDLATRHNLEQLQPTAEVVVQTVPVVQVNIMYNSKADQVVADMGITVMLKVLQAMQALDHQPDQLEVL